MALVLSAQLALAAAEPPQKPGRTATSPKRSPRPSAPAPAGGAPPPTHVDAEHIEYRYKEHRTVMTGKPLVTLRRLDAVLVCRKLTADNGEDGGIERAVCEGDVKLTQGDRVVTCQRATYDGASGRVVCRGEPVLRDGASVIRSEEVVYDVDQDRVELTRSKGTLVQKPGQELPLGRKAGDR